MKRLIIITFLAITYFAQAQELPSIPANGFAFPLGSKFTIKLIPTDSVNFDYSVLSFEPFEKIVDTYKKDKLFKKKGQDSTIVFYFCLGTHGKTKQEKDKNMRVLLIMKNYSKEALNYTSEIQLKEDGEYQETSNVGAYPGAIGTEIWPYMIYSIGLREFRKFGSDTDFTEIVESEENNLKTTAEIENAFRNRFQLILSDLGKLQLNDVILKEHEWGGVDNMPEYNRSIAESYYPNPNKFPLDTFKEYSYKSSLIENSIIYYATKENGLIRVVSLNWEEPFFINEELENEVNETLRNQLVFLENMIVQEAGKHIDSEKEENYISKTWKTANGLTIYLEHMKSFERIRMIIYKD
ncbi:MAG TPA: hypothetical protein PLF32_01320 [Bacteroidales bacterium]|nr:hypothetical protein [Bacteroidales bacterium]HOR81280.1 hypothetical protein [Bacteroidales bacterium]HPJ90547.1 hypothetical protein [Bacteroidales bacterium]